MVGLLSPWRHIIYVQLSLRACMLPAREERWKEGGREEEREGEMEGGREGEREGEMEGGREGECLPALLEFAQARPTMSCIALVIIGASLSEPHLGPYSGCGLCHIMMDNNISYVLAPVYKRLYCIRDVTYISRAHALRANVKPAH